MRIEMKKRLQLPIHFMLIWSDMDYNQSKFYLFFYFNFFSPENVVIFSEKDEFDKLKPTPPKTVKR